MSARDPHQRSMSCADVRALLPLIVDAELDPSQQAAVDDHLAQCQSCAREVHVEAALKARIGSALREADQQDMPPMLVQRLRRRLTRERSVQSARRLAAPAALAAGLVGLLTVTTGNALSPIVDESVQHHTYDMVVDYASQDAGRIERVLSQRIGHAMRVPIFKSGAVSLRGARLVRMNKRPAAYLVYTTPRSKISVIAMPDPQRLIDIRDERLTRPEGRPLMVHRAAGFNVVVWRQRDTVYSMVSDLAPREMMQLAFEERVPAHPVAPPPVIRVSY